MSCQSVGQPIDWPASLCDLCLPFLSHLKGEVSWSDRVMYKSSTWLVIPRWALYQPFILSLAKSYTGRGGIWCETIEMGYSVRNCRSKSSMNIITLSTLIRDETSTRLAIALIKSHILKWPWWHCDSEVQDEMRVCHFSAMIALLNLAMMTISRRVFATVAYKMKRKERSEWEEKEVHRLPLPIWLLSMSSLADVNKSAEWIPINVSPYCSNQHSLPYKV